MQADLTPRASGKAGLRRHGLEQGRPLKSTAEIDVSAEEVWEVIAEPGGLARYHPFCAATEVERWPGTGSRDSITYYSGIRYQRNFVAWEEGVGYDIELGDPPDQTARVLWRIEPTSQRTCRLSIEVFPLLKSDLGEEKKRAYEERLFGEVLQHYLGCVVAGVKFFATTGNAVIEDQFGPNPLYSGQAQRAENDQAGGRKEPRRSRP